MIEGVGAIEIQGSPESIVEFVLDVDRYKLADPKIAKVHSATWDGDVGRMRFSGKLRGIPSPAIVVDVNLERDRSIDIRADESTFLGRMVRFHGTFEIDELEPGRCVVRHLERFNFRAPLKWVAEPLLGKWLANDTPAEMIRLRDMIEAGLPAGDGSTV